MCFTQLSSLLRSKLKNVDYVLYLCILKFQHSAF